MQRRLNDATPEEWTRASRTAMERIKQEQYGKGYEDGYSQGYEDALSDLMEWEQAVIESTPPIEVPEEVSEYGRMQIEQGCINGGCDD